MSDENNLLSNKGNIKNLNREKQEIMILSIEIGNKEKKFLKFIVIENQNN